MQCAVLTIPQKGVDKPHSTDSMSLYADLGTARKEHEMQTKFLERGSVRAAKGAPGTSAHFILKPFVQTPDAEIALDRQAPTALRWNDVWGRTCGNPAVSVISVQCHK
jgi:hypothetical protein